MKYLKTKIYIVVCIVMVISLLSISAVCNQCGKTATTIEITESTEKETTSEEAETVLEEGKVSTTTLSVKETTVSTSEESPELTTIETTAAESTAEDLQTPTLNLEIYEGPTYSADDEVCYYRVEAIITGNPVPDVDFSKDDSGGAWGNKKCQVNLNDPSETYTLIAKATNSEGYATDSLILTWGCEAEPTEETEEDIIFEGWDLGTITPGLIPTLDKLILNPRDIGYIVRPSGVNTDTAIFGDSISNTQVLGYFGFGIFSGFEGRTIESISLQLNTYRYWDDALVSIFGNIKGTIMRDPIFPLDALDWSGTLITDMIFDHFQEPIIWTGTNLKNAIQAKINEGKPVEFRFYYTLSPYTDGDYQIDGREYRRQDVTLTVEFAD